MIDAITKALLVVSLSLALAGVGVRPSAGRSPGARAPAASRASPDVVVRIGAPQPAAAVPPGFLGLSLETYAVQTYTGADPHATNPVFTALMRALSPKGRLVFRIGGDSADQTWWPIHGMATPPGVTYALTPRWAASVRELAVVSGARLVLDLNLKSGSPQVAAQEAQRMVRDVGRGRIAALEIGNEPERYAASRLELPDGSVRSGRPAGYDLAAYVREFARWRAGLPGIALAGPATGSLSWLRDAGLLVSREKRLRLLTFHFYPLNKCVQDRRSPAYPTVPNLLSVGSSRGLLARLAPYITMAHRRGLALRLDELNAVTCHGKAGVSNTFASALWVIDTLFELARLGVDGVNVHMWPGAPAAQLFTFSRTNGRWSAHVRPLYYGLLVFAQAAPAGSRLLQIRATPSRDLRSWATVAPDGRDRVVLINDSLTKPVTVLIPAAAGAPPAQLTRLLAPRASATGGVTLAGRSFTSATTTGILSGPPRTISVTLGTRGYTVTVPRASAAILTFALP